jgi:uncharacterized protein
MRMTLWIGALATIGVLYAQDISGDWQGTLKAGTQEFRLVVKIDKRANGDWNAMLLSIDQGPDRGAGIAANSVTLQGANLKFTIDAARATYEGKVSADGASIQGYLDARPSPTT